VQIYFSRHARRRAKLYGIPESAIQTFVQANACVQGMNEIIVTMEDFKYPIKIVVSRRQNELTVITNYPLKKGHK